MERKGLVVCGVVGFLGLLSAATGFGAEGTRIKSSQVASNPPDVCEHPRSPALPLGLTAAMSLLIAQIIINVSTGCICCRRSPGISDSSWRLALLCFVLSWFTFGLGFLLLLGGAVLNDQHGDQGMYFDTSNCYFVQPGAFAGAAILSLATAAFGIVYYITLSAGKNAVDGTSMPNQGGIAMGQPQFPPTQTSQEPVFVHEDTYTRRQFT